MFYTRKLIFHFDRRTFDGTVCSRNLVSFHYNIPFFGDPLPYPEPLFIFISLCPYLRVVPKLNFSKKRINNIE